MSKAWGGRFQGSTDALVERFTESISFDQKLHRQDIEGSQAHARMLGETGIITAVEADAIIKTLAQIGQEIEEGKFEFEIAKEDIHLNIESALIARLGDVGRKLHTGRSRNDQVALDLKLWTREQLDAIRDAIDRLQASYVEAARRSGDLIIPGYTHLQRAQPVLAAHYLLAYVEKCERDRTRILDCRKRLNELPLGAAALAGTSLPINRQRVAELLHFDGPAANSLDVSSDRDFVVESVFVCTMIAEHLSSWAEEWILWSTTEFDFIRLPDAYCTGSSIMPQKKNPDALELIRGRTARVIASLSGLLVLIKGLPLAYNRDLQEDKLHLFSAVEVVRDSIEVAIRIVDGFEWNQSQIESRLEDGFLDATTLMEKLIAFGVPMRSAHEAVGRLVREAIEQNVRLSQLPLELFEGLAPGRGSELRHSLGAMKAVQAFVSEGSTSPSQVHRQLDAWTERLKKRSSGDQLHRSGETD